MFTGIVEELGKVGHRTERGEGVRLEIEASSVLSDVSDGASIAVNGCCLTVVDSGADWWAAHVQPESLRRTCLGALQVGDPVNLERPVRLSDRLGGHLVQGHVDATGSLGRRKALDDGSVEMHFGAPSEILRYVVGKGSIAVDGISLTVTTVDADGFGVAVIPHTLEVTNLGTKGEGACVNLEVDLIAKYVERLVAPRA